MKGKVYIVGAGPGDPKLLTLRALEVIRKADVVLYDRLVSAEVLQLLPKHARRRCVGKSPPRKRKLQQSEINDILIGEARRAQNVLRLKGGDPFIFSRGGEEVEALKRKGIDFEVVPGISSAIAAPLYAGIPLTHRDLSSSVAITTTREASSKRAPRVKLSEIASSVDTLVILMGASTLGRSCMELIRGGLSRDTPVAAIQWATTERQRITLFTLGEATSDRRSLAFKPPCVIVVGRTAALANDLGWFRKGKVHTCKGFRVTWARGKVEGRKE